MMGPRGPTSRAPRAAGGPARRPKNHGILSGDPGGIRTRDLDLERVASLARLDDGVR